MQNRSDLSKLLPDEIWENILSFTTPSDLCSTAALINKRLNAISHSEQLWKQITGGKTKKEYCSPFAQSNSPQTCLHELRRGNILGFLNSKGYFDTRYGYLNLSDENVQFLLMQEFAKTDLNVNDLEILFDFEQLLTDMENQNARLATIGYSSKIHFLSSNFIAILVYQKCYPNVLEVMKSMKIRTVSDCQELATVFCDHKLNREQIKSLKSEANIPQFDAIPQYIKSEHYQQFLAEHKISTVQRILAYEFNMQEEDKAALVDMLPIKTSTKDSQPWYKLSVAGFLWKSSKEIQEQALHDKTALHHLRKLCGYAKGICKKKNDTENADCLRKVESILIENIDNIAMGKKISLSQTELEQFRASALNALSGKIEIDVVDHINRLASFPLHSKEFETELEILMDRSYRLQLTMRV